MYEAARRAARMRMKHFSGGITTFGLAHLGHTAVRLHDSKLAYHCLMRIARDYTYSSPLCAVRSRRRIYNLDANFGYPTVVMEMLAFSRVGCLELLPALPAEKLPRGRMTGALCRGQFRLDELAWDMTKGDIAVRLHATYTTPKRKKAKKLLVKFPYPPKSVTCDTKDVVLAPSRHGPAYRLLTIPAGARFVLQAKGTLPTSKK